MIKLRISDKTEAFRGECRAWLAAHQPLSSDGEAKLDAFIRVGRAWQAELAAARLVGVHWPSQYGGRGLTLVEEAIVQEELVRSGSPQLLGLFGITMVGPVLIEHGSAEQKARFLSKIISAQEIWCQGFSEPGAGSDLAAIRTRARPTTGGFTLSGQKTWTSFAHIADWCFVLARTSEEGQRHQGLSYLLVSMKSPGVSTRPLRQISGDLEFNEVFFDDVFVPQDQVVGNVGDGWRIAISTLMHERVVLSFARQLQSETALREIVAALGAENHRPLRRRAAHEVAKACAVRALAYEHLLSYAAGAKPGPEGSLDKLLWSESFQEISQLAMQITGKSAAYGEESKRAGQAVHRYLYSRGRTIAAGSSEIQRNIVAERILGLPRLSYK